MATKSPIALYSGKLKELQSGDTLPVAAIPSLAYQPLDATLTALAGANWAANSLAIGSGADTVAQVTFAANTFPARASAGNLVAKAITDFGLALVADANAAAGRSTLGLGTISTQDADNVLITGGYVHTSWASLGMGTFGGFDLSIRANDSSNTADRILFINVNDANRSLDLYGDLTVTGTAALQGTNTGDQASIVGISGTKAQFNTANTDGDFVFTSDIGSTVQAYDADLTTWAGITPGTNVGTALAVNVGVAGAFVVNGGVLGTPSSGNLTSCTFPTLNQSTTGSAATLTTPRAIYGNNFDGSAALAQIIASTFGGTGNGFTKFSGPATAEKTFTLPNASATILTTNAVVTPAQGGSGTSTVFTTGSVLVAGASGVYSQDNSGLFYSSPNLGLGTNTLVNSGGYATLTINGSTGGQIAFKSGGTDKGYIYNDATNLNIYAFGSTVFTNGSVKIVGTVGFNNTAPIAKPTVTGSRGGNAALASVLAALSNYGLITDSSTA